MTKTNLKDTRLRNAFVTGQNAYWDGYSINCMDDAGVMNKAEIEAYKKGFIEERKGVRGR